MQESNSKFEPMISDKVFDRETMMCSKLSREKGGECNWGKCESCGVIPLLYKFSKGVLLETVEEVENAKKNILNI
jgi:hypothetical protein